MQGILWLAEELLEWLCSMDLVIYTAADIIFDLYDVIILQDNYIEYTIVSVYNTIYFIYIK
jgi:uncharacterized membrane protein YcfT